MYSTCSRSQATLEPTGRQECVCVQHAQSVAGYIEADQKPSSLSKKLQKLNEPLDINLTSRQNLVRVQNAERSSLKPDILTLGQIFAFWFKHLLQSCICHVKAYKRPTYLAQGLQLMSFGLQAAQMAFGLPKQHSNRQDTNDLTLLCTTKSL